MTGWWYRCRSRPRAAGGARLTDAVLVVAVRDAAGSAGRFAADCGRGTEALCADVWGPHDETARRECSQALQFYLMAMRRTTPIESTFSRHSGLEPVSVAVGNVVGTV